MGTLRESSTISLKDVKIKDNFWSQYQELVRDVVIPYQWEALNDNIPDAEPSYAIRNFKIAAGEEQGEFGGFVFQDSDLAKWLEAVGYSLAVSPNQELEELADKAIDLIEKAQHEDGYLNTYFTLKEPNKRWTNLLDCHELYCAGHMIEAAVAYYKGTGKRKLLDVMCRFADYIDSVFGTEPGKLRGYCGHQEIELALVKLYKATGEDKYLNLAKYFIDERGQEPSYFHMEWEKRGGISHWTKSKTPKPSVDYNQAHLPVREQTAAVGHSVRAVYMYTAMADLAAETGDESLLEACRRLWNNIASKQMYVTGGIGSTAHGEAFTFDYDLPNDTVYAETCASIGLVFFAQRMLQLEAKGVYGDVLERALYNTVVSGMAKDGKHFFYVNPLEVWPEASHKNPTRHHVKPVRQKWFGCACCPPNVARLLTSLGQYIYTTSDDTIYTHLYIGGEAKLDVAGSKVKLTQVTNYPWSGDVKLKVSADKESTFTLALRIPGWCREFKIWVNGEELKCREVRDGYVFLTRKWKNGDKVELVLDMSVDIIQANPKVKSNAGKVALQRGPLVYCLEEADNGANLQAITLDISKPITANYEESFLGGAVVLTVEGTREDENSWSEELYKPLQVAEKTVELKAVPYFMWGNREPGEMLVWMRYK
jgi:uncharacterized protein